MDCYDISSIGADKDEEFDEVVEQVARKVNKFRNSFIFRIGVVIVAVKIVDVLGRIAIEKARNRTA